MLKVDNQVQFNFNLNHELYEKLIPENHKFRKLLELTDFRFVVDEIKDSYCLDNGRNAIDPIVMFKYLVLKVLSGLSDVDLINHTMYDLSFKYFLGMDPMETNLINPATLSKFRRKRLIDETLLMTLIGKTIQIAKENNLITSTSIIVDATHTNAKYNLLSQHEILQKTSKALRKHMYEYSDAYVDAFPKKPNNGKLEDILTYCKEIKEIVEKDEKAMDIQKIEEAYNLLSEVIEDNIINLKQSYDEEARVGHKSADTNFYGYKTHIAVNEERLITAATITTGEKHDGKQLARLIEESEANGQEVRTVIGDGAYSEKDNIKYAEDNGIELVAKLSKTVTHGNRKNGVDFEYNKDAEMYVCKAGHQAIKRVKSGSKADKKGVNTLVEAYYFDVEKCKVCPYRKGCYREGSKTKSYSVKIKDATHSKQMEFMESEHFKEKAKERYKIEAINAHIKNDYGYRTANSRGVLGMNIQAATTLFVCNLERILVLKDKQ